MYGPPMYERLDFFSMWGVVRILGHVFPTQGVFQPWKLIWDPWVYKFEILAGDLLDY